ncbi:putative bifunctional diguanylate cyclase/phosphodiesterase [Muricoccus pecuniae]|uniref:Diguanylate cyclase (GGDEF)-like protein n=1 Tax=Muricoccus pecuniae TaxID=693023 RepID=A0A840YER1_9PROT|nr:EAL domain-containing protein [Roseomonas pecuniae]MBB5694691.1 diguanylate cyclase (GGDEF)-like protein [Roseomonas pecuniae]
MQRRFLARVLPALAVATASVSLACGGIIYQATWSRILDKQTRLLPALATSLAEPLWGLRYEAVQGLIEGLAADSDITSIVVRDDRGLMIASFGAETATSSAARLRQAIHRNQAHGAEVAGSVTLGVSPKRAWDDALSGLLAGFATALASGLAVLVGVVSVNRSLIVRPLNLLVSGIQKTQRDGAHHRIPDAGAGPEFDQVISAFNAMQDRLEADGRERTKLAHRLDVALTNMAQGIALYGKDGELLLVNQRYRDLLGLPPGLVAPGMSLREVIAVSLKAGIHGQQEAVRVYREQMDICARRQPARYVLELRSQRVISVSHEPLPDGGWVRTYEDITERRRSNEQIVYLARHDALTGLPNRTTFGERLEAALGDLGRGTGFAVLCLDLDRFKEVNDTLGHGVGDALLRTVAERLAACARETDTVARLGGDEFAILQTRLDHPDQATVLAQRLIDTVSAPYELDGHHVGIGLSIGIALAPQDGSAAEALLRNADMALYRAKTDGRGVHRYFEKEMDARLQARRQLEMDLRHAITAQEFELHYQPLLCTRRQRVTGFEALVRWRHPQRGLVRPDEFIPIAEETGMITEIGEWVLRAACLQARAWPEDIKIAVNLSPAQFRKARLVETVMEALAESGLSPGRLELEITETALLNDTEMTLVVLNRLREHGVRIAMDDFGTGYSSLSYLRQFPFDKIKIDKSFVHGIAGGAEAVAIVRAVAGLGISLGVQTTAEGVETPEQLAQVTSEGCTEVQGYLFSPPRPGAETGALIARLNAAAPLGQARAG